MPVYTPTTWNPGAAPGVSADNLNHIESGIAGALAKDGSDTMTGKLAVTQTLSGANKTFLDLTASDGKRYSIGITTAGDFFVYNATDNKTVLYVKASGGISSDVPGSTIITTRNGSALAVPLFTGTNNPSSPPTGSVWIKA